MRRSVLLLVGRRGVAGGWRQGWRRARGARAGEDTVPERDLDAIFKSDATSILSLSSLPTLSHRLSDSPAAELSSTDAENAGYRKYSPESAPWSDLNPRSIPLFDAGIRASRRAASPFPEFPLRATYGEFRRELRANFASGMNEG